jgi:hypothetical protein
LFRFYIKGIISFAPKHLKTARVYLEIFGANEMMMRYSQVYFLCPLCSVVNAFDLFLRFIYFAGNAVTSAKKKVCTQN